MVMTNPRPEENILARYYQSDAYISHSNKSLSIVDQLYKISRTFTLKWKHGLIQKYSLQKPSSILDFGCGTGTFLEECKKNNMEISGVEPSNTARNQAERKTAEKIAADIKEIPKTFDVITMWHVLEHVSDLKETIQTLKGHLNENGTMFIAVPNHQSLDGKKYREFWAGYDVPRHLWHFTRETMTLLLAQHDLKLTNVVPMHLDAYYVSMLSEKYKSSNNRLVGMAKAFVQGWKSNQKAKTTGEYSSLIYLARK